MVILVQLNIRLCDMKVKKVKTNVNLEKVPLLRGDFSERDLSALVNTQARNRAILEVYKQQSRK